VGSAIFDGRRSHLEAVQRDIAARAEQEQRELQADIRKVLTPDQQARFDRWLEQQPRGRRGRPPI
jgi:Spy/CpxP family protein refolding chaperone